MNETKPLTDQGAKLIKNLLGDSEYTDDFISGIRSDLEYHLNPILPHDPLVDAPLTVGELVSITEDLLHHIPPLEKIAKQILQPHSAGHVLAIAEKTHGSILPELLAELVNLLARIKTEANKSRDRMKQVTKQGSSTKSAIHSNNIDDFIVGEYVLSFGQRPKIGKNTIFIQVFGFVRSLYGLEEVTALDRRARASLQRLETQKSPTIADQQNIADASLYHLKKAYPCLSSEILEVLKEQPLNDRNNQIRRTLKPENI